MKHLIKSSLIFIFCCIALLLKAQTNIPTNEDIKISIQPGNADGQLMLTGKIENLTTKTFSLNYIISVTPRNKKSFRTRQKNKFLLDSLAHMDVGKIIVPYHPDAIYDITLKIFYDTILISFLELNNEKQETVVGTGLIIDATRTKNGRDFYSLFNKFWLAAEEETNAMIKVEEKPGRSRSTQILIYINNNLIMRQMLRTRYDDIKNQAKYGLNITLQTLKSNPSLNRITTNGDLKGNGLN